MYVKSRIDKIPYAKIPTDKIPYAESALCRNSNCPNALQPLISSLTWKKIPTKTKGHRPCYASIFFKRKRTWKNSEIGKNQILDTIYKS